MTRKPAATVRVVPAPGLNFEPVETTPEEAEALVATGSFTHEKDQEAAVAADKEAGNG